MDLTSRNHPSIWRPVVFGVLILGVLLSASPLVRNVPWRDSGIFLYIGETLRTGGLPYRDTWDHKPPLIYFINALGLWIGHGSWWGVWVVELVSLSFAVALSVRLAGLVFDEVAGFFASAAWLASLGLVFDGGNLTEEYALPAQFAVLLLFLRSERLQRYGWRGPAIGLLTAALFFLRQNLIGVGGAVVLGIIGMRIASRRWWRLATELVGIAGGFLAGAVAVVVYLTWTRTLGDCWDQAFRFNFEIICGSDVQQLQLSRLRTLAEGFRILAPSGIALLGLAAWLFTGWRCLSHRAETTPIRIVFLIGLPLEFLFTALSGRWFAHYYMAWLPMCALGAGEFGKALAGRRQTGVPAWLAVLLVAMSIGPLSRSVQHIVSGQQPSAVFQAVEFVRASTSAGDTVLVLGNDPAVNFMAHRRAPTRFLGQFPLYTPGYTTPAHIEEFLSALAATPPVLIFDTYAALLDGPSVDPAIRHPWWVRNRASLLPELEGVFQYIASRYEYVGKVADWAVYRYNPGRG